MDGSGYGQEPEGKKHSRSVMGPLRSVDKRASASGQGGHERLLTEHLRRRERVGQEALMITATSRSIRRRSQVSAMQPRSTSSSGRGSQTHVVPTTSSGEYYNSAKHGPSDNGNHIWRSLDSRSVTSFQEGRQLLGCRWWPGKRAAAVPRAERIELLIFWHGSYTYIMVTQHISLSLQKDCGVGLVQRL